MTAPAAFLAMWAAGIAGGAALVLAWRIVGPGFTWLTAGTTLVLALGAAGMARTARPLIGAAAALGALLLAVRTIRWSSLLLAVAALMLLAFAASSRWPAALTGALALGGVTSELLLGHWYLVDPRLPRWALRRLALVGIAGLALDLIASTYFFRDSWGLWPAVLAGTAMLLMVGVWLALRGRGYRAVMAATGLAYLALICALAATAVPRLSPVPF